MSHTQQEYKFSTGLVCLISDHSIIARNSENVCLIQETISDHGTISGNLNLPSTMVPYLGKKKLYVSFMDRP